MFSIVTQLPVIKRLVDVGGIDMKRLDNGNFELTEDELRDLLIRDHKLRALELSKFSGVDTWDNYIDAEDHYLK